MNERIVALLTAIDEALAADARGGTLDMYLIGRAAMVWLYGSIETTTAIDILRPAGNEELVKRAETLFGKGTDEANKHGLYLEMVLPAYTTMGNYTARAIRIEGPWSVLRVFRLDPHDLIISKLRRFSPKDRQDIRELCDRKQIDPDKLERILGEAIQFYCEKDGDEYNDRPFANLRVVQKYLRGEIREF